MRTINRSSTTLATFVVAAGALIPPSVSAQDLCAEVIQAVNHGKAGFAQIKGAPGTGRFGRAGRTFDSTFDMTSVSPECDVWADKDRPQQLRLSCHRISREAGCEPEARRVYERLVEPLRQCVARMFPKAQVLEHPLISVGRSNREALEFRSVADAVSGYQLNLDLSWSVTRLSSTTVCRVGIDVEMR